MSERSEIYLYKHERDRKREQMKLWRQMHVLALKLGCSREKANDLSNDAVSDFNERFPE